MEWIFDIGILLGATTTPSSSQIWIPIEYPFVNNIKQQEQYSNNQRNNSASFVLLVSIKAYYISTLGYSEPVVYSEFNAKKKMQSQIYW